MLGMRPGRDQEWGPWGHQEGGMSRGPGGVGAGRVASTRRLCCRDPRVRLDAASQPHFPF